MLFDPDKFGAAMGEAIRKAVEPLQNEIATLKAQLAQKPDFSHAIAAEVKSQVAMIQPPKDGKDCDMEVVKALVDEAVKAVPVINGKDGSDGKDGINGKDGDRGLPGEKGADGLGLAGAMIDRAGALQITLTNGEVKSLGPVVGKDGTNGVDGIGFESFELEYLPESHEIAVKASAAGRVKELRYPAGGIRPGNYWREGTKAKAAEAWVHDGSLWIATKDTTTKPDASGSDWIIAARKGRDGERGQKGIDGAQPAPIKLKD